MRYACSNCDILVDGELRSDMALIVADEIVTDLLPASRIAADVPIIDLDGDLLVPGFIDLQVNGGNGALFNDAPSVAALRKIAEAHWQYGTTAFLPTLISDDLEKIKLAVKTVEDAIAQGVPGIVGIHIEGPFLNIDRRGIHDRQKIRKFDDDGLKAISPVHGGTTLLTIAPECLDAGDINALLRRKIRLCAGHTNATYEQLAEAFEAGVSGVTHLFNAMSQLTNREPGAVGAALLNPDVWCCIIVDGKHVHPATLQVALRAKGGHGRLILVTDAMPTVGLKHKAFHLNGRDVSVIDGVCQDGFGTLAGSDIDMARSVLNAQELLGLSFSDAVAMASANPASFLGIDQELGSLTIGKKANMVRMNRSGVVQSTWINGSMVWSSNPHQSGIMAKISQ